MMGTRPLGATLAIVALVAGTLASPGALAGDGPPTSPQGWWVAGDLHIHTTYSHDSYGGPGDDNTGPNHFYTLGHSVASQFAVARSRGLDYLAITDHNDVRSQSDPGWETAEDLGVIAVTGYEKSLQGHAQMLGAREVYDNNLVTSDPPASTSDVQALADELRADGGVFQVNHPMEGSVDHPNDPDWGYGYDVVPDTVEVWNISRLWQPPAPSASSNDDAVRYWEGFLDRGYKVGATGGSDNHYVATTAVQGAGQPTTWVYVTERTEEGVLEGLRTGRTFISHQPPAYAGPRIFLEADSDGDGTFESMVGDEVPTGSQLRVRVENAPGSFLHVATDGGEEAFGPVPVTAPTFEHRFTLPSDKSWVRAEVVEPDGQDERRLLCDAQVGSRTTYCRNKLLVLAMTSPLYVGGSSQHTKLGFTTSSATSGQYSDEVRFEAQLTTDDGDPIPAQAVAFDLTGPEERSFTATTDENGIASAAITLTERPGAYELSANYAGEDDRYEPSSDTVPFVIEKEDTDLALSKTDRGARTTLVAVLSDRDNAAGISQRTVAFFADGTPLCEAVTNDEGEAVCEPPPRYRNGPHDYLAVFDGDDYYLSSEGTAP